MAIFLICPICNNPFRRINPSQKTCSRKCQRARFESRSIIDRFLKNVHKEEPPGCWHWTGLKNRGGYGTFYAEKHMQLAHRLSYEFANGRILPIIEVCHDCPTGDNPSCVNPNHLFLGTRYDNVHDSIRKNRHAHGERHHSVTHPEVIPHGEKHWATRFTELQVQEIKRMLPNYSNIEISKLFHVARQTINGIRRGEKWKHVL